MAIPGRVPAGPVPPGSPPAPARLCATGLQAQDSDGSVGMLQAMSLDERFELYHWLGHLAFH